MIGYIEACLPIAGVFLFDRTVLRGAAAWCYLSAAAHDNSYNKVMLVKQSATANRSGVSISDRTQQNSSHRAKFSCRFSYCLRARSGVAKIWGTLAPPPWDAGVADHYKHATSPHLLSHQIWSLWVKP